MGWKKGQGVGRSKKNALLKPIQFNPRPPGLGLGSIPKKEILEKIKNGEIITNRDLVNTNHEHYKLIGDDDGLGSENNMVKFGDKVKIYKGKYEGLDAVLKEVNEDERFAVVELGLNQKNVKVALRHLRKFKKKKLNEKVKEAKMKKVKKKKKKKFKPLEWITVGIKLKIVSRKYEKGKFYLETGVVSDILTPEVFTFVTDQGQILDDLKEKQMQTVMPKKGMNVKILKGEYKGKIAALVERRKKDNAVKVQLSEDGRIVELTQDDCSTVA